MPVLPEVASRMILSRVSAPDRSPSAIMRAAGRSFTEPPGFFHSAFAYSSTFRRPASKLDRRISGVFPIKSTMEAAVRGSPGVATGISDCSSRLLYLFARPPLRVTNFDRADVQLLQLRLDRLAIADRHHDHGVRRQVLLR